MSEEAEPLVADENEPNLSKERDKRFIELFAGSGFDLSKREELAAQAGYKPGYAAKMNSGRIIKALVNNQKMQKALKKRGIDFDKLAEKIEELLECKHPAFPDNPDNAIRHKALETALRIKDAFPPQRVDVDKTERKEIVISGEVIQRLEKFEKFKELDVESCEITRNND
jgi:hypothetical protein